MHNLRNKRASIRRSAVGCLMAMLLGFTLLPVYGCDYDDLVTALTGDDNDDFDWDQIGDEFEDELEDEFD